jgi:hypothetical protein
LGFNALSVLMPKITFAFKFILVLFIQPQKIQFLVTCPYSHSLNNNSQSRSQCCSVHILKFRCTPHLTSSYLSLQYGKAHRCHPFLPLYRPQMTISTRLSWFNTTTSSTSQKRSTAIRSSQKTPMAHSKAPLTSCCTYFFLC